MHDFTPIPATVGGLLIGLAASLVLLSHGKTAGISGILATALGPSTPDASFPRYFLAGLILAGILARVAIPTLATTSSASLGLIALAGLLVGFGTQLGSGCTSGHGVCGLSRLSKRSFVATLTFMATGIVTVTLLRMMQGRP